MPPEPALAGRIQTAHARPTGPADASRHARTPPRSRSSPSSKSAVTPSVSAGRRFCRDDLLLTAAVRSTCVHGSLRSWRGAQSALDPGGAVAGRRRRVRLGVPPGHGRSHRDPRPQPGPGPPGALAPDRLVKRGPGGPPAHAPQRGPSGGRRRCADRALVGNPRTSRPAVTTHAVYSVETDVEAVPEVEALPADALGAYAELMVVLETALERRPAALAL
jgi:hypothetical protein